MANDTQRTDDWYQSRLGRVTASRVADVVAKTRSGWGASRATYMGQLISERLTGRQMSSYINQAMQWGIDTEEDAVTAYELFTDNETEPVGFVSHPTIEMSGASPDRIIGSKGLLEVKCPETKTHIDALLGSSIDGKYIKQVQWQLACTGRNWCDWASFDPRMPGNMQLYVERIDRDDKMIAELEREIRVFLSELDTKLDALTAKYGESDILLEKLQASVA